MTKPKTPRPISLESLPPCAAGITRRDFCATGVGLVVLGAGCGAGVARINVGALSDTDAAGEVVHDLSSGASDLLPTSGGSCTSSAIDVGLASAIASGSAKLFSGTGYNLFICRDGGGLYAMTAICPHQGATLEKEATEFYCPRHSATFDLNGQHPTSPAYTPLTHFAVCLDGNGHALVDYTQTVAATART